MQRWHHRQQHLPRPHRATVRAFLPSPSRHALTALRNSYVLGGTICAGFAAGAAVTALIISFSFRVHNRRKDAKYGKPVKGHTIDLSEFERSPAWRYIV